MTAASKIKNHTYSYSGAVEFLQATVSSLPTAKPNSTIFFASPNQLYIIRISSVIPNKNCSLFFCSSIMRAIFSRRHEHVMYDGNGSHFTCKTTHLRFLTDKRRLSLDEDVADNGVNGNDRIVLRRFSYHKLPQQLFKLSVLKLDGSAFDVNVCRNATVGELKQAVEEVFTTSPKGGQSKISWFHVWGHFCLSYEGQKLINDKIPIRNFGVKDGDQLQFVRHMSIINYSNSTKRCRDENAATKPYPILSSGNAAEEKRGHQSTSQHSSENDEEKNNSSNQQGEDEEVSLRTEFKLTHFLKGWLSYSRLWGGVKKGSPTQTSRPSRFGPKMIKLLG